MQMDQAMPEVDAWTYDLAVKYPPGETLPNRQWYLIIIYTFPDRPWQKR